MESLEFLPALVWEIRIFKGANAVENNALIATDIYKAGKNQDFRRFIFNFLIFLGKVFAKDWEHFELLPA